MTKTLTEQEKKELEALTKKVSDAGSNIYWSDIETKINSYKKITERIKLGKDDFVIKSKTKRLEKQLAIATKALEKYQEAINRFKKDPMNNIIMLAHQLIYDIDIDSKKALKEMEGVK